MDNFVQERDFSKRFSTRDMLLCSIFAALICVGAYISIPIPPVPVTFQWFFVAMAGMLLGAKRGFLSSLLYMIIGLIGVPVFAGGKGGVSIVVSPTFGYIYGFLISAFITGFLSKNLMKKFKNPVIPYFIAGVTGLALVYLLGFLHLCVYMSFVMGKEIVFFELFKSAVLIFLPKDVVMTLLCALVAVKVPKKYLK